MLYYSSFLCVLHFNVVFLLCRSSPLIFDAFTSDLGCNPDLFFFLNPFTNFEQRYITVAFICYYIYVISPVLNPSEAHAFITAFICFGVSIAQT